MPLPGFTGCHTTPVLFLPIPSHVSNAGIVLFAFPFSHLPLRAMRLALWNAQPYVLPTNVSSVDVGLAHKGEISLWSPASPEWFAVWTVVFPP